MSRQLRLGGGSVIGGRIGLALEPALLAELARSRTVALVSGTNGKTTTTRLLAVCMGGPGRVATSSAGANLPSGLAAALAASEPGASAVLEVDEGYLGRVAREVSPAVVALLNLSRDQLDRVSEVRMTAARWRSALSTLENTSIVANCDDPLVAWAAADRAGVFWVAAGQLWRSDAVGCPACEGQIRFSAEDWWCPCGFRRPTPDAWLDGDELVMRDGRRMTLRLSLPGRFNRANAAIAASCASLLGVDLDDASCAMAAVEEVEGRFAWRKLDGKVVRLLLAKNPAGWTELLDLVCEREDPVVIGINARIADGHDPSWLWDVPFERLAGRLVVASGERCDDLAVRLRHAAVDHLVLRSQIEALRALDAGTIDYVGNYTAFQQLRRALAHGARADGPRRTRPAGAPRSAGGSPPGGSGRGSSGASDAGSGPRAVKTRRTTDGVSALRVVVVHPDLLGTYGDSGNGRILVNRASWRGIVAELHMASSGTPLPSSADVYCLGGGEDGPQVRSAEVLRDGALQSAVDAGAAVLAVCAGYQVIGMSFPDADGTARRGVGLLDVTTVKGSARRAVGEILSETSETRSLGETPSATLLSGFENHSGLTSLGNEVRPLARVIVGVGNGTGTSSEGAVSGRVIGTYMHGPVLARNPMLADMILRMVTGSALEPLDDIEEEALRRERLAAVRSRKRRVDLGRARVAAGGFVKSPARR